MHTKSNKSDYVSVWATIDLDTVRQRINRVTCQINQVLQKYGLPTEADNPDNTNH